MQNLKHRKYKWEKLNISSNCVAALTQIGDKLLSILIYRGLTAYHNEVPLVTISAADIIHEVGSILQTSISLRVSVEMNEHQPNLNMSNI